MQRFLGAIFIYLVLLIGPVLAADTAYISVDQVDLAKLLAPPPMAQSEQQKLDLAAVLQAQGSRTPQQAKRAVADNDQTVFHIAGEVLGPDFTAARLPKLKMFFDRIHGNVRALFRATKGVWNRPRPFRASTEVKAVGKLPANGSYPSAHANSGYLAAIILANMVPERRGELFARGREYGLNRIIAGVHFPSDIEAGRIGATAMATALFQNATFMKDFAEAKAELRKELGFPDQ